MNKTITFLLVLFSLQISAQCVQKVGAGSSCTFVIKADGTLWAWGRNHYGQLGIGNVTNTAVKTQVGTASDWQSVEGGQFHTAAIKTDGSLWTWGFNESGQLGLNNTINKTTPTQVAGGNVWKSVAAGYDHTVAIRTDGSLYAWGLNDHGQLGDGLGNNSSLPVRIGTDTWKSVAAGNNVTVGIKTDGTLWAWGESSQVGDGTTADKYSPVQLGTDTNWKSVSRGVTHTLALKTDGTLWAWGTNTRGQLGNGTTNGGLMPPAQSGTDTDWESIEAGFFFSMGKKTDGTIWSWGQGTYHQLGLGASTANVLSPTQIGTDNDWQFISIGSSSLFSEAVKNDGTFWAWGYNNFSQLGDGLTTQLQVPTFISCPASISLTETACDSYTWATNGTTYTQSGLYVDPVTNNDLHLTINNNTTTTTDEVACESYTWVANGTTYTESGTYTNVTTNASGCTDTAVLNLTVDYTTLSLATEVACDSYTWAANGITYTASGSYFKEITTPTGCVHTDELQLTINQSTSSSITETACNSYTWLANGAIYTDSGTYTNVTTNASGCTDTATLNLTINNVEAPTGESAQSITADIADNATLADIAIIPSTVVWYGSEADALEQINALSATTVLTNGNTYYAVNAADGCVSNPFAVSVSVTLGNTSFDNENFSLYPNPTSDFVLIEYSKAISNVSILTMLGQQVIAKSINANQARIDVSSLPAGTYFMKVYSDGQEKMMKIIKE